MKTSAEHRRLINQARSKHGKKNGVIGGWWFDRAEFIWRHADRKWRALRKSSPDESGRDGRRESEDGK